MIGKTMGGKFFDFFNYTLFILFSITILIPFINAISISLSDYSLIESSSVTLWPRGLTFDYYRTLVANYLFLRTFANTVFLTVVNTFLVIAISLAAGYALSSKFLFGTRTIFVYILIPSFFSGGLVPFFLLVNKLGLYNTYWALILPGVVSSFYIIVFRNMISQLPKELLEAAEVDGAGEFAMLRRVVFALVLPMTTAFSIFSAVGYWNEWFGVLLFIRNKNMWTLQYQLRDIMINGKLSGNQVNPLFIQDVHVTPEGLKMAAMMITILPIICIYPFLQKYFIHGQFVGAVKG